MNRLLRYLTTWSLSQLAIVSVLWVAVVVLAALQVTPLRIVLAFWQVSEFMGPINIELPVAAAWVVAIATPIIALVPPIVVLLVWKYARRREVGARAA